MTKLIFIGLAAAFFAACNPNTQNHQEMKTEFKATGMVEVTTFRLNEGVKPTDFEKAALAMQKAFLEKQKGFIKRTLCVSQDSLWTDIVHWQDQQSFENVSGLAEKSELVLPFIEKIDFTSVKMTLAKPILIGE